jgi:hypothetical protein
MYMCKDINFKRESNLATWVKIYTVYYAVASFACLIFTFTNVALTWAGGGGGAKLR